MKLRDPLTANALLTMYAFSTFGRLSRSTLHCSPSLPSPSSLSHSYFNVSPHSENKQWQPASPVQVIIQEGFVTNNDSSFVNFLKVDKILNNKLISFLGSGPFGINDVWVTLIAEGQPTYKYSPWNYSKWQVMPCHVRLRVRVSGDCTRINGLSNVVMFIRFVRFIACCGSRLCGAALFCMCL